MAKYCEHFIYGPNGKNHLCSVKICRKYKGKYFCPYWISLPKVDKVLTDISNKLTDMSNKYDDSVFAIDTIYPQKKSKGSDAIFVYGKEETKLPERFQPSKQKCPVCKIYSLVRAVSEYELSKLKCSVCNRMFIDDYVKLGIYDGYYFNVLKEVDN
jgi:hypothetical protein